MVIFSCCGILAILSCLCFRSHSRGRAQADDEDSMDATDVTPTPDFDIAFEIGENCFLLILLWQFCICNNTVKGICVSQGVVNV